MTLQKKLREREASKAFGRMLKSLREISKPKDGWIILNLDDDIKIKGNQEKLIIYSHGITYCVNSDGIGTITLSDRQQGRADPLVIESILMGLLAQKARK